MFFASESEEEELDDQEDDDLSPVYALSHLLAVLVTSMTSEGEPPNFPLKLNAA